MQSLSLCLKDDFGFFFSFIFEFQKRDLYSFILLDSVDLCEVLEIKKNKIVEISKNLTQEPIRNQFPYDLLIRRDGESALVKQRGPSKALPAAGSYRYKRYHSGHVLFLETNM